MFKLGQSVWIVQNGWSTKVWGRCPEVKSEWGENARSPRLSVLGSVMSRY